MPRLEGIETMPMEREAPAPRNVMPPPTDAAPPEKPPEKTEPKPAAPDKTEKETRKPEDVARDATSLIIERVMDRGKRGKPEEKPDPEKEKEKEKVAKEKTDKEEKRKPGRPKRGASIYAEEGAPPEEPPEEGKKVVTTREDLVKLATETAVRARADAENERPRQPAAPAEPRTNVPANLRDEAERYEAVQALYPEQYAGRDLVKELVVFNSAAETYEKKWVDAHPGEEFDWDDDEHDSWMEANAPGVDPDHVEKAGDELKAWKITQRVKAEAAKEYAPLIEEKRRAELWQKHSGDIYDAKAATIAKIVRALAPELGDDDAVMELLGDPQKLGTELEKDPVVAEVAQMYVAEASSILDTAAKLEFGITPLNLKDPDQQRLQNYLANLEHELSALEEDERPKTRDGRRFVTTEQANRLKDRSGVYTVFDWSALKHIVTVRSVNLAKQAKEASEERHRKVAEARGWVGKNGEPSKEVKEKARASFVPAPSVSAASATGKPSAGSGSHYGPGIPQGLADKLIRKLG